MFVQVVVVMLQVVVVVIVVVTVELEVMSSKSPEQQQHTPIFIPIPPFPPRLFGVAKAVISCSWITPMMKLTMVLQACSHRLPDWEAPTRWTETTKETNQG